MPKTIIFSLVWDLCLLHPTSLVSGESAVHCFYSHLRDVLYPGGPDLHVATVWNISSALSNT